MRQQHSVYLFAVHVDDRVTHCQICYDNIVELLFHNTSTEDVSLVH